MAAGRWRVKTQEVEQVHQWRQRRSSYWPRWEVADFVSLMTSAVGWPRKRRGLAGRVLSQVATIVTPETLLASHRKLIARKYDGNANRGTGRSSRKAKIESPILSIAVEDPRLGLYAHCGYPVELGYTLARGTVANIRSAIVSNRRQSAAGKPAGKSFCRGTGR